MSEVQVITDTTRVYSDTNCKYSVLYKYTMTC